MRRRFQTRAVMRNLGFNLERPKTAFLQTSLEATRNSGREQYTQKRSVTTVTGTAGIWCIRTQNVLCCLPLAQCGAPCVVISDGARYTRSWLCKVTLEHLHRNDRAMLCWTCRVRPQDKTPSTALLTKLDLDEITSVLRSCRLRWHGHVVRSSACIHNVAEMELPGIRGCSRLRKTWQECVRNDKQCGLSDRPVRQLFGRMDI